MREKLLDKLLEVFEMMGDEESKPEMPLEAAAPPEDLEALKEAPEGKIEVMSIEKAEGEEPELSELSEDEEDEVY